MTCYTRNNKELYGLWTGWTDDGEREREREGGHKAASVGRGRGRDSRPAELLMRGCRAAQVALLSGVRSVSRSRSLSNPVDII